MIVIPLFVYFFDTFFILDFSIIDFKIKEFFILSKKKLCFWQSFEICQIGFLFLYDR